MRREYVMYFGGGMLVPLSDALGRAADLHWGEVDTWRSLTRRVSPSPPAPLPSLGEGS
jgi:hypothetical protein